MTAPEQIDHLTKMVALLLSRAGNQALFTQAELVKFEKAWEVQSRIVTFCVRNSTLAMTASYNADAEAVKDWLSSPALAH